MMWTFVALAAVLALLAVAVVAVPLLSGETREAASPRATWAAVAAGVFVVGGAAALYVTWSNWSWAPKTSEIDEISRMVSSLARRLERNPEDLEGWLMLGRSYSVLQQYPLALRAYERADRLAQGRSSEALVGIGEVIAMQDDAQIEGRAGEYFERALAIDPQSGKALFFAAVSSMRRGELPLARDRFQKLLALDPPDNVRGLIEQQVAALDQQIGATVPAAADAAAPDARVRVRIDARADLAEAAGDSTLFVFVRDPDAPGPPLAVRRLPAKFPVQVELSATDAMMPGHAIAAGRKVQVVARISRSGQAQAASGDPFGEVGYDVGKDTERVILIDRLSP